MRIDGTQLVSKPSFTDQPVASTIASPPPTWYGPRLNRFSIRPMPDSPSVWLRIVAACRTPHFHLDVLSTNWSFTSFTPSVRDLARLSSTVSTLFFVVWSSQNGSFG